MCFVRVRDHIADSLRGRTGSTVGSVFSVSVCLNTVQLKTCARASSGVLCFTSCYKDPQRLSAVEDTQRAPRFGCDLLLSLCIFRLQSKWDVPGPQWSQHISLVKKRKNKCVRGGIIWITLFFSTGSESPCTFEW